jgi:hypothetical protein
MLINQHPAYAKMILDWEQMRDTYAGERSVKLKGERYLKPTAGMHLDGMGLEQMGRKRYDAYKDRAVFHDFVKDGVEYYIGLLHEEPAVINVPDKLKPMVECMTLQHESAQQLLRRINEQQLVAGRMGLMLDLPEKPVITPERPLLPYVASYLAEAVTNWDVGFRDEIDVPKLNLVVLNESGYKRNASFQWEFRQAFRVLVLGLPDVNEETGIYSQALFTGQDATFDASRLVAPNLMGKTLEDIPFVFANAQDNLPDPNLPPLLGLSNLALAIYRAEADYRQNLFMQGQDTLVVIGGKDEEVRTGAGSVINLKAGPGVDAKFIGVTATGLAEQRSALENDKMAAQNKAGQLFDTRSKAKESGDALNTRVAAQAATLNAVALSGGYALERLLKLAATWVGANPDEVEVIPNTEWTPKQFLAADLKDLMTAKKLGAPISLESVHDIMMDSGMTEMDFEDEMSAIDSEAPEVVGTDAGGNPVDAKGNSIDPNTGEVITSPFKKPVSPNNAPPEDPPIGKGPMSPAAKAAQAKAAAKKKPKPKAK